MATTLTTFLWQISLTDTFVPISGQNGDNILEPSGHMPVEPFCLKLWIVSCHQLVQLTSPCICPSRMYTVPVVWVETGVLKPSIMVTFALVNVKTEVKSLKCTRKLWVKLFLRTMWASVSRMCLSKMSLIAMQLVTAKMTHHVLPGWLSVDLWTYLVRGIEENN